MDFIADASCCLPWVLLDESTPWTRRMLDCIQNGDRVWVPSHWPVEVLNGLLMAQRRQRILPGRALSFWEFVSSLPIKVEAPLNRGQLQIVLRLAERHSLTVYDAIYLELSQRLNLPLATLDDALIRAAQRDGSMLVT